jgi:ADP-ribose pyrophosphatase YjhB (NUDIX family)
MGQLPVETQQPSAHTRSTNLLALATESVNTASMKPSSRTNLRRRKNIPERLWKRILASISVPCVDLIIYNGAKRETRVLLGYRKIYPYNDRWALPGGRIIKNESLRETANRQLEEIGLRPTGNYRLVGVYPVNFKRRSDITICLSTRLPSQQEPRPTRELSRYAWRGLNDLPSRVGSNYRRMLRDFKDGHYIVR